MSTRSLFVLVLAMVLGTALSVRWYLEADGGPLGARSTWTLQREAAAAGPVRVSGAGHWSPAPQAGPAADIQEAVREASPRCTKSMVPPETALPVEPGKAAAAAATALQSVPTGVDAL